MKSSIMVAAPPPKPLVIYDGDCRFCAVWIERWRRATGDRVDYIPFQEPRLAQHYPEVPREWLEAAVHLIETDGAVYSGAEAAFRALAHGPLRSRVLFLYQRLPAFAQASEWAYRLVAEHRTFFSKLTWLAWGRRVEPAHHELVRWVFLRALAAIYLVAFVSLWVQIVGLVGSDGILPAKMMMESVKSQAVADKLGTERFHLLPTLCWFSASDSFLKGQCAAGSILAVLVLAGVAPAPCLFLLWLIYLSLATVCREFLGFQWDILLLETGFLAIFFGPWQLLPGLGLGRADPPSRLVLWLLRWLLFKLMFASGCVKLMSGDPTWRNLTALNFHYETQPLPTWIGWYAHQLPASAQKSSLVIMFTIELVLPFLIFWPRRVRQLACGAFVFLQLAIFLTGNYCFFNLLTIALCLVLLDDAPLRKLAPRRWRGRLDRSSLPQENTKITKTGTKESEAKELTRATAECSAGVRLDASTPGARPLVARWRWVVTVPLAAIILLVSLIQFSSTLHQPIHWPTPAVALYEWLLPFRSINSYGLFAVMTTSRPEIIIEGSDDGIQWREYEFKYKPSDLKRPPRFVEPHQPRLDWQMWFAALGTYQQNPWLINFCVRLLQGSPPVLGLLEHNPFPNAPPRYIRAVVYEYHFTDWVTRRRTGAWWCREPKGEYLPPLTPEGRRQKAE